MVKCVKFESNDKYNCIRKTNLNGDDLSAYDIIRAAARGGSFAPGGKFLGAAKYS